MSTKAVYIAGPMTGLPEYNYPAFFEAEAKFAADGWTTFNPARHDASWITDDMDPDWVRAQYMRQDIIDVMDADAIALLPGWQMSKGAAVELAVARILCKQVLDAVTMEPLDAAVLV
jgi:hypothetical protein